ncbi:MAG: hypothetical protein R3Y54_02820, partial [Eubacteriales bacterium]
HRSESESSQSVDKVEEPKEYIEHVEVVDNQEDDNQSTEDKVISIIGYVIAFIATKVGKLITGILSFIGVLVLLYVLYVYMNEKESLGISSSYMTQYSSTVTVGEAFDDFFSNSTWTNYEVGSNTMVEFTGGCQYLNSPAEAVIQFRLENNGTFHLISITMNGTKFNADNFLENLMITGFMEKIYD